MQTELAPAESRALIEHEAVIERGLTTFTEVGNALLAIREQRLYRAEHDTFEGYCRERWGFNDRRASQLIAAAATVSTIVETGLPAPANEHQARALAAVPEAQRAEVWRETVDRTGGKPTAAAIRDTHRAAELRKEATDYDEFAERVGHGLGPAYRNLATELRGEAQQLLNPDTDTEPSEDIASESAAMFAIPQTLLSEPLAVDYAKLDAQLDAVMEGTDGRFRRNFAAASVKAGDLTSFDPERIAEVFANNWDRDVGDLIATLTSWCERVIEARNRYRRAGLRIVGGD
jgi:hypothetical protein